MLESPIEYDVDEISKRYTDKIFKLFIDSESPTDNVNESKVATNESPLGYYTTANALHPEKLFKKLDENGIGYKHDTYSNFIEVFVEDIDQAKLVRELSLDMYIFEADDIDDDDLPYIEEDGPGDMMEIKMDDNDQYGTFEEEVDVDEDIIEKAREKRHEETKSDLQDETKKVFNSTSKVEDELEQNEDNFTIHPKGEDFKLMKKMVGEKVDYTILRKVLKENFPGWEDHTESILEAWELIN